MDTGWTTSWMRFPIDRVSDLIWCYKTHQKFLMDSKTLAEAAKPKKFKDGTKWEDWKPTFLNYLPAIPGRDGVRLKVCLPWQRCSRSHNEQGFLGWLLCYGTPMWGSVHNWFTSGQHIPRYLCFRQWHCRSLDPGLTTFQWRTWSVQTTCWTLWGCGNPCYQHSRSRWNLKPVCAGEKPPTHVVGRIWEASYSCV